MSLKQWTTGCSKKGGNSRHAKWRAAGVTFYNTELSCKAPCHSPAFAEVFWLKTSLPHLPRSSPLCAEAQAPAQCAGKGSWCHCWGQLWLPAHPSLGCAAGKGGWINLLGFCGSIPLLQPRSHFFLLSQACLGCARCQANLQLALHRAGIQPFRIFLGWYMVLFLSLSERVQATELDRVLFLTGTATDKRISQLKSLFQKWCVSVFW